MPAAKKGTPATAPSIFLVELRVTTTDGGNAASDTDSLLEMLAQDLEDLTVLSLQPVGRESEEVEFNVAIVGAIEPKDA